uniref:thiol oxidase n=1 Tax=viral metagenome TaxID=1070528 RepID=A0A6C0FA55_9ZZZZ
MIFTNSRTINRNKNSSNMIFVVPHNEPPVTQLQKPKIIQRQIELNVSNTGKVKVWGPYIWYMLHGLAEKIKDKSFYGLKNELLEHIFNICVNLPCPSCSTHSREYLQKIDFKKIKTKQELRLMLLDFHNNVNTRLRKPIFSYQQLIDKYKTVNFNNVINNFFIFFEDKHKTVNMLSNDMYTQRISNNIRNWLSKNYHHFE